MSQVEVQHSGGVARVTMDRPPLNIIDLGFARELAGAIEDLFRHPEVDVVVLAARGKAFCAGVDVRDHLPDRGAEMLREFHRVCFALLELEVPVVAAVQGAALGGGCELTLVCDLVVASERATFGQPEIKLGVFPPLAAAALPQMVPGHIASEMILTGRTLTAVEARQVGLVNRVAGPDQFDATVETLVDELTALSPESLRLTKHALRLARRRPHPAEVDAAERYYVEHLMRTPDAIEGLQSFIERRTPAWSTRAKVTRT